MPLFKTTQRTKLNERIAIGLLLAVFLLALRLPWIFADAGVPGMKAYGFFNTDEAEYTDGGRQAYLTGKFFDPELSQPRTIKTSFGMHLLSYWGHQVLGLSYGSMRLFPILVAVAGWISIHTVLSRKTLPRLSAMIVLITSCNPVSLTYERMASTDVVAGSLAAITLALLSSGSSLLWLVGGIVFAFGISVKLSILGFVPLILLAVIAMKSGNRYNLSYFLGGLVFTGLCIFTYFKTYVSPLIDAGKTRLDQISSLINFDPLITLYSSAIWPRGFLTTQTGPLFALMLLVCGWQIFNWLNRKSRFHLSVAVSLGLLLYLLFLSTQAFNPVRYLTPCFFFAPLCLWKLRESRISNSHLNIIFIVIGLSTMCLFWMFYKTEPVPSGVMIMEYVLAPVRFTAIPLVLKTFFVGITYLLLLRYCRTGKVASLFLSVLYGVFMFAAVDYSVLGIENSASAIFSIQITFLALLTILWGAYQIKAINLYATIFIAYLVLAFSNSFWRTAYAHLPVIRSDLQKEARIFNDNVKEDSIVLGEQATTLLRDTRHRLVYFGFDKNAESFTEGIKEILRQNPSKRLYWIVARHEGRMLNWRSTLNQNGIVMNKEFILLLRSQFDETKEPAYVFSLQLSRNEL